MTTYIQGIIFDSRGNYVDQNSVHFVNQTDREYLLHLLREHLYMHIRIQMNVPNLKSIQVFYGGVYREGTYVLKWDNPDIGFHYKLELPNMKFKLNNVDLVVRFQEEWFSWE